MNNLGNINLYGAAPPVPTIASTASASGAGGTGNAWAANFVKRQQMMVTQADIDGVKPAVEAYLQPAHGASLSPCLVGDLKPESVILMVRPNGIATYRIDSPPTPGQTITLQRTHLDGDANSSPPTLRVDPHTVSHVMVIKPTIEAHFTDPQVVQAVKNFEEAWDFVFPGFRKAVAVTSGAQSSDAVGAAPSHTTPPNPIVGDTKATTEPPKPTEPKPTKTQMGHNGMPAPQLQSIIEGNSHDIRTQNSGQLEALTRGLMETSPHPEASQSFFSSLGANAGIICCAVTVATLLKLLTTWSHSLFPISQFGPLNKMDGITLSDARVAIKAMGEKACAKVFPTSEINDENLLLLFYNVLGVIDNAIGRFKPPLRQALKDGATKLHKEVIAEISELPSGTSDRLKALEVAYEAFCSYLQSVFFAATTNATDSVDPVVAVAKTALPDVKAKDSPLHCALQKIQVTYLSKTSAKPPPTKTPQAPGSGTTTSKRKRGAGGGGSKKKTATGGGNGRKVLQKKEDEEEQDDNEEEEEETAGKNETKKLPCLYYLSTTGCTNTNCKFSHDVKWARMSKADKLLALKRWKEISATEKGQHLGSLRFTKGYDLLRELDE